MLHIEHCLLQPHKQWYGDDKGTAIPQRHESPINGDKVILVHYTPILVYIYMKLASF